MVSVDAHIVIETIVFLVIVGSVDRPLLCELWWVCSIEQKALEGGRNQDRFVLVFASTWGPVAVV